MKRLTRAPVGPLLFSLSALLLAGCQSTSSVSTPAAMVLPVCINDECAVLDHNGVVQVPVDNDYDAVYDAPMNSTLLYARDGVWSLASGDGKQVLKAAFTDELWTLTPGYFGFKRDGKFGVMDEQGKVIQPPSYDEVFEGGDNEFIVYEVDGKRGFLSATGQKLSDPVFEEGRVRGNFAERGNWILAERDGASWALSITTGELKKVAFAEIDVFAPSAVLPNSPERSTAAAPRRMRSSSTQCGRASTRANSAARHAGGLSTLPMPSASACWNRAQPPRVDCTQSATASASGSPCQRACFSLAKRGSSVRMPSRRSKGEGCGSRQRVAPGMRSSAGVSSGQCAGLIAVMLQPRYDHLVTTIKHDTCHLQVRSADRNRRPTGGPVALPAQPASAFSMSLAMSSGLVVGA